MKPHFVPKWTLKSNAHECRESGWNTVLPENRNGGTYYRFLISAPQTAAWLMADEPPSSAGNYPKDEDKPTRITILGMDNHGNPFVIASYFREMEAVEKTRLEEIMRIRGNPNGAWDVEVRLPSVTTVLNCFHTRDPRVGGPLPESCVIVNLNMPRDRQSYEAYGREVDHENEKLDVQIRAMKMKIEVLQKRNARLDERNKLLSAWDEL